MHTIQIIDFDYTLGSGPATAWSVAQIEEQIDFGFTVMFDDYIIEQFLGHLENTIGQQQDPAAGEGAIERQ